MCAITDCEIELKARGYCHRHLKRFYKYGDPLGKPVLKKDTPQHCRIEDCDKRFIARGMCQMHYRRWKLYGNPLFRKLDPNKRIDTSYKSVIAYGHPNASPTGKILEHRLVMSEMLGRALLPNENVHHKNGDRKDNRPENLELWNTSQPAGQRIEDKVEFAKMILELYAPEHLSVKVTS